MSKCVQFFEPYLKNQLSYDKNSILIEIGISLIVGIIEYWIIVGLTECCWISICRRTKYSLVVDFTDMKFSDKTVAGKLGCMKKTTYIMSF